jgi:hypothetical protein
MLLDLPTEVLVHSLDYLDWQTLLLLRVSRAPLVPADCAEKLWREQCRRVWASKSERFHLATAPDGPDGLSGGGGWQDLFKSAWVDGQRTHLLPREMATLDFSFNYVRGGPANLTTAIFRPSPGPTGNLASGALLLPNYPPLRYILEPDAIDPTHPQFLLIENFPPHKVARTPKWEWIIWNDNVVIVSDPNPFEAVRTHTHTHTDTHKYKPKQT